MLVIADDLTAIAIAIDPLLINQSLINLINNAVQVNQNLTRMKVIISVKVVDNNRVSVIVFNEGKIIAEDKQSVIFNLYYSSQEHKKNQRLRFINCEKILLDQGADICCLAEDKGAAFQITLPLIT